MSDSTIQLVDRMREGRKSPAILKIALSNIRSSNPDKSVFVFEGADDVGPYEVWIARCDAFLDYEPLPGKGKQQVLAFRDLLMNDKTGLNHCVFFFIDQDYDDPAGMTVTEDIFVLDCYSTENMLCGKEVIVSFLKDELRCAANPEARDDILRKFERVQRDFNELVKDINFRLFVSVKAGIRVLNLADSVLRFVEVSVDNVGRIAGSNVDDFVRLEREPTEDELRLHRAEFDLLSPATGYRGKFQLQFVYKWLFLLGQDRRSPEPRMFAEGVQAIGNMQSSLTMRGLASRSRLPSRLCDFLDTVKRKCPCSRLSYAA